MKKLTSPLLFRRASLLVLVFWGAGCRPFVVLPAKEVPPVQVRSVGASFSSENHAELKLSLLVPNPTLVVGEAVQVSWELWLQGRWFAAGTRALHEPLPATQTRELSLSFPMAFRTLTVTREPTPLQVGVRGSIDARFGNEHRELSFEDGRRVVTDGAPVFAPTEEDD
jgi:hypothetical protein